MNEVASKLEPIRAGGALSPIIPQSFDEVQRLADVAVKAGLYKADSVEVAIAQACMVILQGLECGVPPTQAIQQIAVINGRCVIWGDLLPALVWARGHKIKEWFDGEGDNLTAYCSITRGDNGETIERSFSVADAKAAGLWDTREKIRRKDKSGNWYDKDNDSPWFRFRKRMLQMRSRGFACRDGVPDVLRGMYVREELDETVDITPKRKEPQTLQIVPDIPDVPDVPDMEAEEPVSVEGVLNDLGNHLEQATSIADVLATEREFGPAIMNMDDDARDMAVEMIQAAKESMKAEAAE